MPIEYLKRDIKRHRPIDWFAMLVLISAAIVISSFLEARIDEFSHDMDIEARIMQSDLQDLKELIRMRQLR